MGAAVVGQTFSCNGTTGADGSVQSFTVPAGICTVTVDVYGAQGGSGSATIGPGGLGGRATATIAVTPDEVLEVRVGGQGLTGGTAGSGGFNGGNGGALSNVVGGGGGASDVRQGGDDSGDRVVVAGGGGGGGGVSTAEGSSLSGGTFDVTLTTAGNHTVTATDTTDTTDTADSGITGTGGTEVAPADADRFDVSAPGSATAGTPFSTTVTALDAFGNTVTSYAGTVQFTSSDPAATLPADTSLTDGVGTFDVTLATAGNQTVTATDSVDAGVTGTSAGIAVETPPSLGTPPACPTATEACPVAARPTFVG